MKARIWIILVVLIALTTSMNQSVYAEIITVEVTGIVDYFSTEGGFALDGSVSIGSSMTGFCSYDTDTPDQADGEDMGIFPMISISMTIGNYTFTHDLVSADYPYFAVSTVDPTYAAISPNPCFDGIIYVDSSPQTYDDITWGYTYLRPFNLWTSSSEYIPTDALPDLDSWPDLSVFDMRREFRVRFYDESSRSFNIIGEVTSLAVIPEPATILLLSLGSLALITNRRFR